MPDNQTISNCQSIFDQKNDFNFLALVQSRIEQFSLKTYKISEQQVTSKEFSVANSCHYDENFTKNFIYRQMSCPLGAAPTNPLPPGQKLGYKSHRVGKNFWCKSPGGRLWMKLIPAYVN